MEGKNNFEKLKKIIDREVESGKGELITGHDGFLYGIKVDGYRITFYSMLKGQYIGRTMFESYIPQTTLDYYKKRLQQKVIPLMREKRDTLDFEERQGFL